ncbi:hypothetical protein Enr13x_29560 [Stieleria neptunia]|uniref:Formyltransferase/hydrolase complex Fhc subunit B n=1 Tax=Stieleria neptunia TaxID=2527979 RepID=A0A518HQI1_9BACT|nr:hypothetical protein [Stieleria neptunia]QDV43102.1 hypothetical protein Enr13x_29560 [Stieleria neptunia]
MPNDPIVCPFCPLCCDDVRVDAASGETDVPCELARNELAAAVRTPSARIGSQAIDSIDWHALGESLTLPPTPVVEFNGATIAEAKTLETLVNAGRIQLRIADTACSRALDQTIARDGLLGTTLGDAVRRAEYFWVIGNLDPRTPRLKERLNRSGAAMEYTPTATIGLLSRLHERLGGLSGGAAETVTPTGAEPDRLHEHFRNSRSTVVVVGGAPFESGQEVIAGELLIRWIARWNELALPIDDGGDPIVSRVSLLRMTADQNLRTVIRWRNNQVSPSDLSSPLEPTIRVGSPVGQVATPVRLQIGGVDPGEPLAHAYLPAAVPGVHHADTTIRGDGSVTLPLAGWTDSPHVRRVEALERVLGVR